MVWRGLRAGTRACCPAPEPAERAGPPVAWEEVEENWSKPGRQHLSNGAILVPEWVLRS